MDHSPRTSAAPSGRRFPDLPFWLDDDPARELRRGAEAAGAAAWAIGAGIREAVLGRAPYAPRVVEVLVAGDAATAREAARLSGLRREPSPSGTATVSAGPTRFVLRPLGPGDPLPLLQAAASERDFTANAVLCGLDGSVVDPLDGVTDIAGRRVRLARPSSLRDDPVRVIRLARMRVVLGEAEPDPEAASEAAFYGPDVALCDPSRVLGEIVRLLRCRPVPALVRALRDLDAVGALDGVALVPAIDRLGRFLPAAIRDGIDVDPATALGVLTALDVRGSGWIDGHRLRFGDGRDAAVSRVSRLLEDPSALAAGDAGLARLLAEAAAPERAR